jgi:hypothetical protein
MPSISETAKRDDARNCIYCNSSRPANEEHPLPRCLGEFKNAPKLYSVCTECNGKIGRESEEQFCRAGPEAFFRNYFGVKGRKSHETVNPFERGSAGSLPIDIVGVHPTSGIKVLYEKDPGMNTCRELRQIVVIDGDGNSYPIRISNWMKTQKDIEQEIKKMKLKELKRIHVFANADEMDWVRSLTDGLAEKVTWSEQPDGLSISQFEVQVSVTVAYFRAVAKASFHYFLATDNSISGSEPIFAGIRDFILSGTDEKPFVTRERTPIMAYPKPKIFHENWGCRLKTPGHVLVVDCNNGELFGRIQYFISSDIEESVYRVNIAKNVGDLVRPLARGHLYSYYPDGPKDGYDGVVSELTPMKL